jgi:hypothetical protein
MINLNFVIMKLEIIISQLHTLKDEALNSKMDEPTVTHKIKEAIDLVSPLSELFIELPSDSDERSFVREFDNFINKTKGSVDRVINRSSDLLFFCNTVFRMVDSYSEENLVS